MNAVILAVILSLLLSINEIALANSTLIKKKLCADHVNYLCYKVKKNENWQKLFPDTQQRNLVMSLNRINIPLHAGMTIVIPTNLSTVSKIDHAPLPKLIPAPGEKIIHVSLNPHVLAWGAYDAAGVLQEWGPVSGGRGWCPDTGKHCRTPIGKFVVYRKEGAECVSSKFPIGHGGAPMPYCMFFHGGFALHGSHEVPGHHASHGCVRIFVSDAKWLNEKFVTEKGVPVIITP